ncbi:MAG: hypothetical protein QNJ55_14525 [Xenococcus sp. MO_188.B8]|nr:hypothetical protein [Xenococcus sp. MO_188.B8]
MVGQIRDSQLPAKMIIDEEGSGVTLIAKHNDNQTIELIIEKCIFDDKVSRPIYLKVTMETKKLIQSFYDGITDFIKDRYSISDSSFVVLSNINWDALLQQPAELPDWKTRLAMYGDGQSQYLKTGIETVQLRE